MKYTDIDYTLIVPLAVAANLKELSRRLDRADCAGMLVSELNAIGSAVGAPATHFVSSGRLPLAYLNAITDPVRLYTIAKAAWERDGDVFPFTQAQVTNRLGQCFLSDGSFTSTIGGVTAARPETPHAFIERKGLTARRVAI